MRAELAPLVSPSVSSAPDRGAGYLDGKAFAGDDARVWGAIPPCVTGDSAAS